MPRAARPLRSPTSSSLTHSPPPPPPHLPLHEKQTEEKLPVLRYREGEPLAELAQYMPAAAAADAAGAAAAGAPSTTPSSAQPPLVEVRIPADAASNQNRQVRARQLWGTDVYTSDSDVVAALMHQGYYSHALAAPPPGVAEVRAVLALLPPAARYVGSSRNAVRSRGWGVRPDTGCAFRVERAYLVLRSGATAELARCAGGAPAPAPTFKPAAAARAMSTRASASASERRARALQEVALQYCLANEPWLKYSVGAVADRGLKRAAWTSTRLATQVLLLETRDVRFELSQVDAPGGAAGTSGGGGDGDNGDGSAATASGQPHYRWARVRRPLPLRRMRALGLPLPSEEVEVLHPALAWEDLAWGPAGVLVKGELVPIVRVHFTARCPPGSGADGTAGGEEEEE
jgi:hypothetical protein